MQHFRIWGRIAETPVENFTILSGGAKRSALIASRHYISPCLASRTFPVSLLVHLAAVLPGCFKFSDTVLDTFKMETQPTMLWYTITRYWGIDGDMVYMTKSARLDVWQKSI